jgi:hypothetical protein
LTAPAFAHTVAPAPTFTPTRAFVPDVASVMAAAAFAFGSAIAFFFSAHEAHASAGAFAADCGTAVAPLHAVTAPAAALAVSAATARTVAPAPTHALFPAVDGTGYHINPTTVSFVVYLDVAVFACLWISTGATALEPEQERH